jgi:hypothetical protein
MWRVTKASSLALAFLLLTKCHQTANLKTLLGFPWPEVREKKKEEKNQEMSIFEFPLVAKLICNVYHLGRKYNNFEAI